MEDPALEEDYVDEIIAEVRRARAELRAMSPEERETYSREVMEDARSRGMVLIDSDDHPMHPRNVRRRQAEQGYVWVPPDVPPPRTM
jgi:hypothetical protein